jgi:CubicO group peptidase (beta-lactamase class C family)
VAVLAVAIQFLGVIAPSTMITNAGKDLTGYQLFTRSAHGKPVLVPYGRDPIRWIPELSPLLLQAKVVLSKASFSVGGPPITTTYHPYEGRSISVRLDDAHLSRYGFGTVYVWWAQGGVGKFAVAGVAFFLLTGAAATALLVSVARRPEPQAPI